MKNILLIALCLAYFTPNSQCDSAKELLWNKKADKSWVINGQSKSGRLESGVEYTMSFVGYKGIDYKLRIGTHIENMSGTVEYEIYEKVSNKVEKDGRVTYEKELKYLFKNSEHDNTNEVEFSCTKTKKLYVRVVVHSDEADAAKAHEDNSDPENKSFYYCVGVLILQQASLKTGF